MERSIEKKNWTRENRDKLFCYRRENGISFYVDGNSLLIFITPALISDVPNSKRDGIPVFGIMEDNGIIRQLTDEEKAICLDLGYYPFGIDGRNLPKQLFLTSDQKQTLGLLSANDKEIIQLKNKISELTESLNETREQVQALLDYCFTDKSRWKEGSSNIMKGAEIEKKDRKY